jgi:hypothetical protein
MFSLVFIFIINIGCNLYLAFLSMDSKITSHVFTLLYFLLAFLLFPTSLFFTRKKIKKDGVENISKWRRNISIGILLIFLFLFNQMALDLVFSSKSDMAGVGIIWLNLPSPLYAIIFTLISFDLPSKYFQKEFQKTNDISHSRYLFYTTLFISIGALFIIFLTSL